MPVGARVRGRVCVWIHSIISDPHLGSQQEGSCILQQLVIVLHFGTCCVLAHRGKGITFDCWALQFCLLEVYCRFCFCFSSRSPPFFPLCLRCMHSVQMLALKWLAQGKSRSVSLVSRSWMALSNLAPYLYYLNFANFCSFKQNRQTGSILDQWPARIWPFVYEMITVSFVYHAIYKSELELFLKSKERKQEMCVR